MAPAPRMTKYVGTLFELVASRGIQCFASLKPRIAGMMETLPVSRATACRGYQLDDVYFLGSHGYFLVSDESSGSAQDIRACS